MGKNDLLPGTLDMMVLKALTRGALHGYAIAQLLRQLSEDILQVEEGSLYPALQRLELNGWIEYEVHSIGFPSRQAPPCFRGGGFAIGPPANLVPALLGSGSRGVGRPRVRCGRRAIRQIGR